MKCSVCDLGLGPTWVSIAGRYPSGTIHVMNAHRECLLVELGKAGLRKIDSLLHRAGWVQESLPIG